MHIGILFCGHTYGEVAARHGDFGGMFEALLAGHGFTFSYYDVENMEFPASVTERDGWLLTGSKHGAYEDHAFLPPLEDFIRAAYGAGVPQVGICFGHQIIAQALGGRVIKVPEGWGVGRHLYQIDGREVALTAWHQDQVVALPPDAQVIGRSAFCENAALVYGSRALTYQPHPEFSPEITRTYVTSRRGTGTYEDDRMEAAAAAFDAPLDQGFAAAQIAAFFKDAQNG